MYIALIGDMIDSKGLSNRTETQKQLTLVLSQLNKEYDETLASYFTITLGDEFQAVFKQGEVVLEVIDKIKYLMAPVDFRFGIGVGDISTDIQKELSLGADGPAYWYARQAINDIHQKNDYELSRILISQGQDDVTVKLMNDSLAICDYTESRWRDTQRELLIKSIVNFGYSRKVPQKKLADMLNISNQAANQRIQSSGYYQYLRLKETISQQLEELREEKA